MTEHIPDPAAAQPDQYTFGDPRTRYPVIRPPVQQQDEPGIQSEMTPVPDLGEVSYRGTGRLTGRRALITGADSGIGGAVAIAFAREGADITMSYRPEEESDARHVADIIERAGRTATLVPGDLTDPAYCRALVRTAVSAMGGLDAVVNVAGKQVWQPTLAELSDEQFEQTYATNVFALFWIVKAAVPHLAPGSTIINTASLEAYTPAPDRLDYASTKGAINNLSKGLAQQLIPHGIRVNVVAPGPRCRSRGAWTPRRSPSSDPVRRRWDEPRNRPSWPLPTSFSPPQNPASSSGRPST
jgi:NAD(P)-dependent dehydrogenase (short-subunit alcohol dehydrogenase family)